MDTPTIAKVQHLNEEDKDNRQLKLTLSNGRVITAEACHESWEQWGGTLAELYVTMPVVEAHNEWLHGADRPEDIAAWTPGKIVGYWNAEGREIYNRSKGGGK